MSKLRVLKVLVQPVLILDDGADDLREIVEDVKVIPAADWEKYSGEQFPRELADAQARLDAEYEAASSERE